MALATAEIIEFEQPEHGDGGGGGLHAECAEAFRLFLVKLTMRVGERGPIHAAVLEQELIAMFKEYAEKEKSA